MESLRSRPLRRQWKAMESKSYEKAMKGNGSNGPQLPMLLRIVLCDSSGSALEPRSSLYASAVYIIIPNKRASSARKEAEAHKEEPAIAGERMTLCDGEDCKECCGGSQ